MSEFRAEDWASQHQAFFELAVDEAAGVIEHWRDTAASATGIDDVELAGPFQRHFTARGTGVPTNFCLVLTAAEALAFKFDPAVTEHPLLTGADQFKGEEARWPRTAVRVSELDPGRMAWGVTIEVDGQRAIPCRTPRLPRNPAAAAVAAALGAVVPTTAA